MLERLSITLRCFFTLVSFGLAILTFLIRVRGFLPISNSHCDSVTCFRCSPHPEMRREAIKGPRWNDRARNGTVRELVVHTPTSAGTMAANYPMERIKLLSDHVTIRQPKNTEGIGFSLTFEVERGSTSDLELDQHFSTGATFPFLYKNESLAITLRSMTDRKSTRIYEGTTGFLSPGMGNAGG